MRMISVVKYLILLTAAAGMTLVTIFIPIQGVELTKFSDPDCSIRAAGLPFAFISKFVDDPLIRRPPKCHEPQPLDVPSISTVLKNAAFISIPFLLDVMFWTVFLAAASALVGRVLNFFKIGLTKYQ
jgi:hypothetical protein